MPSVSVVDEDENTVHLQDLELDVPYPLTIAGVDLVLIRRPDGSVSALYGRCAHRGVPLADGHVEGNTLVCGVHGWRYDVATGIAPVNNSVALATFPTEIRDGRVHVDRTAVSEYAARHPRAVPAGDYQAQFSDVGATPEEPFVADIRELAGHGLTRLGMHGKTGAMGVPRAELPSWNSIQFVTAQLARPPLLDDEPVDTRVVVGPTAARPLTLDIPLMVTDMSFGALSQEAKVALAAGAELAGTGICSGEGGMLPEEQQANSKYFYELASGRFGWSFDRLDVVQAFHFKGGQAAKTGTGGHLSGKKVVGKIAEVRGLAPGTDAISPARFPDWTSVDQYVDFAAQVRERSGGIPIGYKMSAQRIEEDIDAALTIGVDYIIIDGRGGGTGAAPLIFRENISVPTIPAVARARRHLDRCG
ncbi:glutamate synthase-related protein, partial [Mycolicibacterium diernhoferi]